MSVVSKILKFIFVSSSLGIGFFLYYFVLELTKNWRIKDIDIQIFDIFSLGIAGLILIIFFVGLGLGVFVTSISYLFK